MSLLSAAAIERALSLLNDELARRGERAEIGIVESAVMCLLHAARPSTKDVDAWFIPTQSVRDAARRVAEDEGLPEDWLNDAAKAFVPEKASFEIWRRYSHLEVLTADLPTLFAMKCAAARSAEDRGDIMFLLSRLGITGPEEALEVVTRFIPPERLPIRTQLMIEDLFDDGP